MEIIVRKTCEFCWYWLPKLSRNYIIAECNLSGKYRTTLFSESCNYWKLDKTKVKRMMEKSKRTPNDHLKIKCLGKECPLRKYPPCGNNIPCCQCSEEYCNSRQPCPAMEGGEE